MSMRKREPLSHISVHSYHLLQDVPWELLAPEAERRGVLVEGRGKNESVRDLFLKVVKPS